MENTENLKATRIAEKLLNEKMNYLTKQRDSVIYCGVKTVMALFALLVVVFLLFSTKINWINLDVNSTKILWIIVFLDIAGLVFVVVRLIRQINNYQTCIRRLDVLLFKVAIKDENSEEKMSDKEICDEMQSIISVFDKKITNE
ncbi:MAG: hypothetical protein II817_00485 [Bacteroidales bacterium]|nr:hypothetical protein [Bacteroidales bacterium]